MRTWRKNNKCQDCGISIDHGARKYCRQCYLKKHVNGKENSHYKNGATLIQHYCKECSNQISLSGFGKTGICRDCASKKRTGENSSNWKGGVTKKQYYCKECNEKIGIQSALRGSGLCRSCGKTGERNHYWKAGRKRIQKYCKDCNKPISYASIRCKSCAKKGAGSPAWRGGVTTLYKRIRELTEYFQWRSDIFKRDNWTCQTCNKKSEADIIAHHIKPFSELLQEFLKEHSQYSTFEDKAILTRLAKKWKPFWEAEGITLCKKCHELTENYGWKQFNIIREAEKIMQEA